MQVLALAARGTLELVAAECRALGLRVLRVGGEGVELDLTAAEIAKALVHLRIAQRLLLKLAAFPAGDAQTLYEGALAVAWGEYLDPRSTFAVHASGDLVPSDERRRGLDTHIFVALRVKDAIADRLTRAYGRRPDVAREDPDVSVVARGRRGHWTLYLDLAEPPLFQRGHRAQPGPAPLKETLAAAIAELVGWSGQGRLHDPMCGSGTLLIEAVNRRLGIAPGCTRWFGVERWPHHGAQMRRLLDAERAAGVEHARTAILRAEDLDVRASDVDPHALAATRANLAAAGLDGVVHVEQQDATRMAAPPAGTVLVANPPYGERLGGSEVVSLYRALGRHWSTFAGCTAWLVDGHPEFQRSFGLPSTREHPLWNGRLPIVLRRYELGGR